MHQFQAASLGKSVLTLQRTAAEVDRGAMDELVVKRWRRYGKDRLYVNTGDGRRVGWMDLATGQRTVERPEFAEAFEHAVAGHREEEPRHATAAPTSEQRDSPSPPAPATKSSGSPDIEPFTVRITYSDLGIRRAGQAAREQADEHRRAAPVRSLASRLLGVHTEERAWRIGADGEKAVAQRLDRLPAPWTILHAVPVGHRGADIDHVVIGPAGVFTVNTKHHPKAAVWVGGDTFLVNGHRQAYIRKSRFEAQRAGRLLTKTAGMDVPVTGVIAVVGAHRGFVVKRQPLGVHVTARTRIARWLTGQPRCLSDAQMHDISNLARRSSTWR